MLDERDIALLSYYLDAKGQRATASEVMKVLDYKSIGDVNLHVVRLAKKLASQFSYTPTFRNNGQKRWWPCLFDGEDTKQGFVWTLKNEVAVWFNSNYLNQRFYQKVAKSSSNINDRRIRLSKAAKKPTKSIVQVWEYKRNPDVVAEVLYLANGKCQKCKNDAPFLRKSDKTPYLEVHHKIPLSDGGDDTVENSIALCPNCHRKEHFG